MIHLVITQKYYYKNTINDKNKCKIDVLCKEKPLLWLYNNPQATIQLTKILKRQMVDLR